MRFTQQSFEGGWPIVSDQVPQGKGKGSEGLVEGRED
jgi:hypothetical protein